MNKQELIKHIEGLPYTEGFFVDTVRIGRSGLLKLINQLDEPQKVEVPQFVADWIDNVKRNGLKQKNNFGFFEEITSDSSAYTVMYHIFKEGIATKNIRNWVSDNTDEFARAWLDGYTVDKEKRYLVKMKNLRALFCYLAYIPDEGYWTLMASGGESIVIKHTRKELEEAGFGEVFNSPLFEVEEVEE